VLIIDENISEIEVWRLREWRIAVRQIGADLARPSTSDDDILPILHRLKRPTFFTRDQDFWKRHLAHTRYCLVFLDIREHEGEVAAAIRRFLRHPAFNTHAKRMGKIVRIHPARLSYWQVGQRALMAERWQGE
jgi:hypothetical protein